MEIWKTIVGYEGWYSVSSHGRVRREKNGPYTKIRKRILKPIKDSYGYYHIDLYKNGIQKNYTIHKLITIAFLGKCPKGLQVNHKDGIKTNNYASNLEYVTHYQNMQHARKNGFFKSKKGSKNGRAKLTEKQVFQIRRLYQKGNIIQRKLGEKFNVSQSIIGFITRKETWKHI